MKIANIPGEWGFKAIYRTKPYGWYLSKGFFLSKDEADKTLLFLHSDLLEVKWPVEVMDNGSVYVADESEWK